MTKFDASEALRKIDRLLQYWQIDPNEDIPAKITIYLHQKSPRHYEALVNVGVIKPLLQ